jgi:hypothetical protein
MTELKMSDIMRGRLLHMIDYFERPKSNVSSLAVSNDISVNPTLKQNQIGIHLGYSSRVRVGCSSNMVTYCLDRWPFKTESGL